MKKVVKLKDFLRDFRNEELENVNELYELDDLEEKFVSLLNMLFYFTSYEIGRFKDSSQYNACH